MRKYKAYSRDEIVSIAKKAEMSIDEICGAIQGDSSAIFNLLYNNSKGFEQARMSPEDYYYSQLYWSCRYLYEVEAKGDEAPDFEASILDILNYLIIVLAELYGEDVDSHQILKIDIELEKEFGIKRKGSFCSESGGGSKLL